ncbi:MAG: solute:sodium symporter family transporter [Fuerstiella sp.]|nr:solute:sodium symporter family transporter [Fuerstiella sp.]
MVVASFVFFTVLVAVITYRVTRNDDHTSSNGFFLAGRTLTFPLIAGSLLLTNLSTEQLVGLNGAAFNDGLCVMVWEVWSVIGMVAMALFFLPRFLKSGIATVPQYLEIRYDHQTQVITNLIFLVAYVCILLPIILYTGATGMIGILDIQTLTGIQSETTVLWAIVWTVGIIGSIYALFGGLRTVAVSDTINGIGLLVGGVMIAYFGLLFLGENSFSDGIEKLGKLPEETFNSIGNNNSSVPFSTLFSGILLLTFFYWTTNQQIIQRTLGASSLAEGQKGVLLTGALKLFGPVYLVLPGIIAVALFADDGIRADHAYGTLVNKVLPAPLTGFFAAVMIGAILSSFNSALNSSCTLFSLGLYQGMINRNPTEQQIVRSGKIFGWAVAAAAMTIAPFLAGTDSIMGYLQKMNGIYFIPLFAVVLVGMLSKRVPPKAAKIALIAGFGIIVLGYFVPPFDLIVQSMHEFHFLGAVFAWLVILQLVIGEISPCKKEFVQQDVGAVDMTPWVHAKKVGVGLIVGVFVIYALFADFSVLRKKEVTPATATAEEIHQQVQNSVADISKLSDAAIVLQSHLADGSAQTADFSELFVEHRTQN